MWRVEEGVEHGLGMRLGGAEWFEEAGEGSVCED